MPISSLRVNTTNEPVPTGESSDPKRVSSIQPGKTPLGYQRLISITASTALTVPDGTTEVRLQAETKPIRWRDDGSPPTASVGSYIPAGKSIKYLGDASAIRVFGEDSTAILHVSYYSIT